MKKIKFNIDGKDYSLNIEKLRSSGLLEEDQVEENKPLTFSVGDVFEHCGGFVRVLIVGCNGFFGGEDRLKNQKYQILGLDGLEPFADFAEPVSHNEMTEFLERNYKWIKNINKDVEGLIGF